MLFDTAGQRCYLLNGSTWLTAADPVRGPWVATKKLPAVLTTLPADANLDRGAQKHPGPADGRHAARGVHGPRSRPS